MLLILSNSTDQSADVLVHLCAERGELVFRFNIDLWLSYRFAWTPDGFSIRDPSGRMISSDEIRACLWRRPFLKDTPQWRGAREEDRAATEAELHALVLEMADWAQARGRLRLVEPSANRRVGRLTQMRVARDFFTVPDWTVGWGFRYPAGRRMVKRFAQEPLGAARDHFLFVRSVEAEQLSPDWPWLTQEIAPGHRDATVLYVDGRCFGFEMDRTREDLGVEDWRSLTGAARYRWRRWAMPDGVAQMIAAYMDRLGLHYGRLDFLAGDELSFLEVNPNGQYAWLDDPQGWPLHSAILDAVLDPASTIRGDECVWEGEGTRGDEGMTRR